MAARAFESSDGFKELAQDLLKSSDTLPIIVHGGGAEISQALRKANREPVFIDGLRVTTQEDIEIVETVLSETVNGRIAAIMEESGIKCQRMSGKTENLFIIEPLTRNGHDMGFVGRVKQVHPKSVLDAVEQGLLPIISPISANESGLSYNVNADSAAGALAAAAECSDLVYFTDVPGVQKNNKTLFKLTLQESKELIDDGTIQGGMIAKMESVFEALEGGVQRVHITQWLGKGSLSTILTANPTTGTTIYR